MRSPMGNNLCVDSISHGMRPLPLHLRMPPVIPVVLLAIGTGADISCTVKKRNFSKNHKIIK